MASDDWSAPSDWDGDRGIDREQDEVEALLTAPGHETPSFKLLLELQAIRRRHPDTAPTINTLIDAMGHIQFSLDAALEQVSA